MRSSTDIVSISTGRETILIGPLSAFGAQAASTVLRDRFSIIQTLEIFAGRPNAAELLRPHLRRWGVDPVSLRIATRHTLVHALARLASNGSIGIAKVPDVTLSFAGASLDEDFKQVSVKPITDLSLPPDLSDRMMLVFEMAPQYMEGETRLAFENAVRDLGMGLIVGAVVAWIGAHFIPGVNIAMLAFDLFFLSATVLHALERAHEIVGDVRDAKSRAELKPAAIAMAAVLSILIVEGVLGRLLRAKILTKGVGKTGGHSDAKPSLGRREARKSKETERVRERDAETRGSSRSEPDAQKADSEPGRLVIGRVSDLQDPRRPLAENEYTLLPRMTNDLGSPKANWKRNNSLLRQEMRNRTPIRDHSNDKPDLFPVPTNEFPGRTMRQTFTGMERNVLRNKGWTFDGSFWNPPGPGN